MEIVEGRLRHIDYFRHMRGRYGTPQESVRCRWLLKNSAPIIYFRPHHQNLVKSTGYVINLQYAEKSQNFSAMSNEVDIRADIEITPEMIEAGISAFELNSINGDVGRGYPSQKALVVEVFRAMYAVSPLAPQAQGPQPSGPVR